MKKYGFTINLKNDQSLEKYKHYHKKVWPEVISALKEIGITKMEIFHTKELSLFMYIEGKNELDPLIDFPRALELHPKVKEWDNIMHKTLLQKTSSNTTPLEWQEIESVFHYEA